MFLTCSSLYFGWTHIANAKAVSSSDGSLFVSSRTSWQIYGRERQREDAVEEHGKSARAEKNRKQSGELELEEVCHDSAFSHRDTGSWV